MKSGKKKITPTVVSTKPLKGAGSEPEQSALVGGVSNHKGNPKDYSK